MRTGFTRRPTHLENGHRSRDSAAASLRSQLRVFRGRSEHLMRVLAGLTLRRLARQRHRFDRRSTTTRPSEDLRSTMLPHGSPQARRPDNLSWPSYATARQGGVGGPALGGDKFGTLVQPIKHTLPNGLCSMPCGFTLRLAPLEACMIGSTRRTSSARERPRLSAGLQEC